MCLFALFTGFGAAVVLCWFSAGGLDLVGICYRNVSLWCMLAVVRWWFWFMLVMVAWVCLIVLFSGFLLRDIIAVS